MRGARPTSSYLGDADMLLKIRSDEKNYAIDVNYRGLVTSHRSILDQTSVVHHGDICPQSKVQSVPTPDISTLRTDTPMVDFHLQKPRILFPVRD